jgi:phosphonate transport system substrate-binding protein
MAPRYLLAQAGLGKHDYKTMFSKKPSNALFATYYGQADASGIGDIALKLPMIKSRFDASEIRILARSEPLPHLPWAVNSQLRPAQVSAIETALFRLNDDPRGKAILAAAGMTAIRPATDAEYDLCRRIIKLVSGEDYRSPKQEGADG